MFWIVAIAQNENGSHDNQTWNNRDYIPEGYAVFSEELEPAYKLENFPFGNIETQNIDGLETVVSWEPLPIPVNPEEPLVDKVSELKNDVLSAIDAV